MPSNLITKTVVVRPGESFTLPPGGTLIYTSDNNGIDTDCQLPPVQSRNCYVFTITVDNDNNDSHPLDETDATLDYVSILGTQYPMNFTINRTTISMFTELKNTLPAGLLELLFVDRRIFDKRNQYWITVRALSNIAETVEFKITGRGYEFGAYVRLVQADDCTLTCPDNHTCYNGVEENNPLDL